MLGVTLFALFIATAVFTLLVLADGFLRGRDAFSRLRRELAAGIADDSVFVMVDGGCCEPARRTVARPRTVSRGCGSRRPASLAPMRAAA